MTSSFASGHAASDLAFVLGPSQELPLFFVPMSGATMAVHRALVRKGAYYPAWISDLEPVADGLVFGGPPECPERPFCLPGLERAFGLRFTELNALDAGGPLSVGALEGNEVDVALLFTSDGHLEGDQFVLLQDDRGLQPPDNLEPVVRKQAVDRFGARLTQAVDRVISSLHTKDLAELNRRVSIDGVKPARAATDWLRSRGLVRT